MLEQRLFDVTRVDVDAAADDEVLDSVDDVEEAVGVEVADVTRVQPSAAQCVRRLVGRMPVTGHQVGTADADLAVLTRRGVGAVGLLDEHLDRRRGLANTSWADLPR